MLSRLTMVAALVVAVPAIAVAQSDFPRRAVKLIVPVPPGNTLDSIPRIIGDKLSTRWNQPVIVENRPGAASNLGAEAVFKSEPDGYTILVTPPGPLVVSQHVYPKLGFDPAAFVPVTTLVRFSFVLIVNPKLPVTNLSELIARAKAKPGTITFGTAGVSSTPHLTMERLSIAAGVKFAHVPYQGFAPALRDLLAGHIDVMFDSPGNMDEHARSGAVRPIAVTGDQRIAGMPNVPPIADTLPGVTHYDWFALVAPPRTPPQIASRFSQAVAEVMKLPDVAERMRNFYMTPLASTPEDTGALMKREAEMYQGVIAATGIRIETPK
jgi:tripartite-type tricarboxylate transporter receptor subunit TctC